MSPDSIKLHIEDVDKSYGTKLVLDNIDLRVAKGELCTLVGPSGCGKSTLLRLLLGQEFACRGQIFIDGVEVGHPDTRRGIVYQKYSLFPHLTVRENVLAGLHFRTAPWFLPWRKNPQHEDAVAEMLRRLRLLDAGHKYPHELSGGMQQRVAIAQALVTKPPILLMDEPFGALDPDTREQMQMYLMDLHAEHQLTIFFVTHDLEEACFVGTRLLVLSQYYSDDRGSAEHIARGAKIVGDYQLTDNALPTSEKRSAIFKAFVEEIRHSGFNPNHLKHVDEFNLRHPHAFRTLTRDESKQFGV